MQRIETASLTCTAHDTAGRTEQTRQIRNGVRRSNMSPAEKVSRRKTGVCAVPAHAAALVRPAELHIEGFPRSAVTPHPNSFAIGWPLSVMHSPQIWRPTCHIQDAGL